MWRWEEKKRPIYEHEYRSHYPSLRKVNKKQPRYSSFMSPKILSLFRRIVVRETAAVAAEGWDEMTEERGK